MRRQLSHQRSDGIDEIRLLHLAEGRRLVKRRSMRDDSPVQSLEQLNCRLDLLPG